MVDRENEIYAAVAVPLRAQFSGIDVASEYVASPATLPHVSIVEMDNYQPEQLMSTAAEEAYSAVTYEVNAYSNLVSGKKAQVRSIIGFIDGLLTGMGFRRASVVVVPNEANASIYRMTARYTGIAHKTQNTIYNA